MFHGASPFPWLGRIDGSNSSQKGDFDNLIFRVGPGQSRNATDCTPATSKRLAGGPPFPRLHSNPHKNVGAPLLCGAKGGRVRPVDSTDRAESARQAAPPQS